MSDERSGGPGDRTGWRLESEPYADVAAVYREHQAFVCRTLVYLGLPRAAVDDALQDVFIVVHRRLCDYSGKTPLRNWLYGIARRIASEYRRGTRRAIRQLAVVPDPEAHAAPPGELSRIESGQLVHRFLESLDEDKREVFVLCELEGMTAPEIAQALGIKVNTVYGRLRAARARFERLLAQHQARRLREEDAWNG